MTDPARSDALHGLMIHNLTMAGRLSERQLNVALKKQCGMDLSQWRALAVLPERGVTSPTAIGAATGMDKVRVSRALHQLATAGRARCVPNVRDGRVKDVQLTAKGAAALAKAAPVVQDFEIALVKAVPSDGLDSVCKALPQIVSALGRDAAPAAA